MFELLKETHFDFMSKRKWAFIFSAAIIVPGLISMAVRGGVRQGVDFTGGVQVELQVVPTGGGAADFPIDQVRAAVAEAGYDNRNIQKAGGGEVNDFLIHVQAADAEKAGGTAEDSGSKHISTAIKEKLQARAVGFNVIERQVQLVGPKVGAELRMAAVQAVLLAILLILVYVAWRFEPRFGVATIIAATHDVLFILGLFSLLNKEMTLTVIAAFLTLIGYSVNDTIVVFDRIREELKLRQKREPYETIFNDAINKTLSRTILTGITTLIVLVALFFFAGEVVHDFAWVLLVGILVGTYSSIFVAAPLVVEWNKRVEARELAKGQRAA